MTHESMILQHAIGIPPYTRIRPLFDTIRTMWWWGHSVEMIAVRPHFTDCVLDRAYEPAFPKPRRTSLAREYEQINEFCYENRTITTTASFAILRGIELARGGTITMAKVPAFNSKNQPHYPPCRPTRTSESRNCVRKPSQPRLRKMQSESCVSSA